MFRQLFLIIFISTLLLNPVNHTTDKPLGVLIIYMDPGIEHSRALKVLDAARNIDAKWIRIGFIWVLANPEKDVYSFKEFDWIINQSIAHGFSILPVVMYTPRWVSSKPLDENYYLYPPIEDKIGNYSSPLGTNGTGYDYLYKFAKVIASRYSDRITHWEFWNEPDMRGSLLSPRNDNSTSREYAKMLAYFYKGIKDGNPMAKVVLGGLADSLDEPSCEKNYFEKILQDEDYPAINNFDIHNIHTNFRSLEEISKQIERNREILNRFGGENKKIWITETSYTPVRRFQNIPGYTSGERSFNKYVKDALKLELESEVEVVFWAVLHDYKPSTPESDPYKYSGLYTYDLRLKKAGVVFRNIADNSKTDIWNEFIQKIYSNIFLMKWFKQFSLRNYVPIDNFKI